LGRPSKNEYVKKFGKFKEKMNKNLQISRNSLRKLRKQKWTAEEDQRDEA